MESMETLHYPRSHCCSLRFGGRIISTSIAEHPISVCFCSLHSSIYFTLHPREEERIAILINTFPERKGNIMQRFRTKNIWFVLQVITAVILIGYALFLFFSLDSGHPSRIWPVITIALAILYGFFDWRRRKNKAKNLL